MSIFQYLKSPIFPIQWVRRNSSAVGSRRLCILLGLDRSIMRWFFEIDCLLPFIPSLLDEEKTETKIYVIRPDFPAQSLFWYVDRVSDLRAFKPDSIEASSSAGESSRQQSHSKGDHTHTHAHTKLGTILARSARAVGSCPYNSNQRLQDLISQCSCTRFKQY